MKMNILIDQSGRIIAAHYRSQHMQMFHTPDHNTSRIRPSTGQSLHEIEIPPELEQHVMKNTFANEIFKYMVERQGEVIKLVKVITNI
jgi:hypothetical protein